MHPLVILGPDWLYQPLRGLGYQFWSGIGSDFGELTLVLGFMAFYWRHTCHVSRCWRLGRHAVSGTAYVTCRRHHPTVPRHVSAEHVHKAHKESQ